MRILGIDPGTARIGWATIDRNAYNPTAVAYGCITTDKTSYRLLEIHTQVTKLIKKFLPDVVAIEDLFFATNAKTAISVSEARGVILLAAQEQHIPVSSYSPVSVKSAITGSGKADKMQVTRMVMYMLKLKERPTPDDTADALAVALTHAYSLKKQLNV